MTTITDADEARRCRRVSYRVEADWGLGAGWTASGGAFAFTSTDGAMLAVETLVLPRRPRAVRIVREPDGGVVFSLELRKPNARKSVLTRGGARQAPVRPSGG